MTTDFAVGLNKFLVNYLPLQKGCSPNTIDTYRYSFIFFLQFLQKEKDLMPDSVSISELTKTNVLGFLSWMEIQRGICAYTRNQRLAAIFSFCRFLMGEFPEYMVEYQRILSIPFKRHEEVPISYLTKEGMRLILSTVDADGEFGERDFLIMSFFLTMGLRVSEVATLIANDIFLDKPYKLLVHGKGKKLRYVPLAKDLVPDVRKYMAEQRLDRPENIAKPLFSNHMGMPLARQGLDYIVKKYATRARSIDHSLIPDDLSCHKLRHSLAMSLLEDDVPLIYIRDILGHASVQTTEIYAKASSSKKKQAIENNAAAIVSKEEPLWVGNENLLNWLKHL